MKLLKWPFIRSFIQYFLPIALIVIIISIILFELRNSSEMHIIKNREKDTINTIKQTFENEFDSIISDLMVLADNDQLVHYLSFNDNKNLNLITNESLSICKWKKKYDQLRFIDSTGFEKMRVNLDGEDCYVVDSENLQNKNERYYFKETLIKKRNEVYISPFDLNVEQGKIEYPLKPVVRFSTPVFDSKSNKKGILIINYLGNKILNRIKKISKGNIGEISVVNKSGYWLLSPDPEDEWGFMFSDGINKKFKYRYPESWEIISNRKSGQFENQNGVFTYQEINLMQESKLDLRIFNEQNQWKIISRIKPEIIEESTSNIFLDYIVFNIYILLLILVVSYLLARAKIRKRIIENSLKEKERLQGVIEMAGAVSHEINQPLQIISTYVDLLTHPDNKSNIKEKQLNKIADQIKRIGKISHKLSKITKYETRDYLKGVKIIDIDKSSDIKE